MCVFVGFEGVNCEVDVDECADTPCENGGECFEMSKPENWRNVRTFSYDNAAGYICKCQPGYTGTENTHKNTHKLYFYIVFKPMRKKSVKNNVQ